MFLLLAHSCWSFNAFSSLRPVTVVKGRLSSSHLSFSSSLIQNSDKAVNQMEINNDKHKFKRNQNHDKNKMCLPGRSTSLILALSGSEEEAITECNTKSSGHKKNGANKETLQMTKNLAQQVGAVAGKNIKRSQESKTFVPSGRRAHLQSLLLGVGVSMMLKIPTNSGTHNNNNNNNREAETVNYEPMHSKSNENYIANAATTSEPKRKVWLSGKSLKEKGDTDRTGTKKDIKYLRCLSNCTSDCKKPGASIDTSDNQSCLEQCQDQCCETYEQCTYKLQRE